MAGTEKAVEGTKMSKGEANWVACGVILCFIRRRARGGQQQALRMQRTSPFCFLSGRWVEGARYVALKEDAGWSDYLTTHEVAQFMRFYLLLFIGVKAEISIWDRNTRRRASPPTLDTGIKSAGMGGTCRTHGRLPFNRQTTNRQTDRQLGWTIIEWITGNRFNSIHWFKLSHDWSWSEHCDGPYGCIWPAEQLSSFHADVERQNHCSRRTDQQ